MTAYATPEDMRFAHDLIGLAPIEAKAYLGLSGAAERQDGLIPPRYRELISVAVALTTQCAYCIDVHTRRAREAGATRGEIAETVFIAASLKAGAAVGHGLLALKLYDGHANGTGGRPPAV